MNDLKDKIKFLSTNELEKLKLLVDQEILRRQKIAKIGDLSLERIVDTSAIKCMDGESLYYGLASKSYEEALLILEKFREDLSDEEFKSFLEKIFKALVNAKIIRGHSLTYTEVKILNYVSSFLYNTDSRHI